MDTDATTNAHDQGAGTLTVECLPVGALAANCYLVIDERTGETLIVDPGDEAERILAALDQRGVRQRVIGILHTHGHFDHVGATEALLQALGPVPILAHPADRYLYTPEARAAGAAYGYAVPEAPAQPTVALDEADPVRVGGASLRVLHTPGHTPGSISLLAEGSWLLAGDTLFRRGIGRTDLLGGDEDAIYESIAEKLYPLPGTLRVLPGHGLATTIGEERSANPFIRGEGWQPTE